MKTLSAFVLLAIFTIVPLAQIPPPPGMPPAAQAQQAFAIVQAQSMIITSQAQLQGMIASQAMMLNSSMARSIFLTQAASLQAQVAGRQGSMFSAQAAAISAMQHSFALQKQLQVQSAILSMRSCGVEESRTRLRCRKRCNSPPWITRVSSAPRCSMCACSDIRPEFVRTNHIQAKFSATAVSRGGHATR